MQASLWFTWATEKQVCCKNKTKTKKNPDGTRTMHCFSNSLRGRRSHTTTESKAGAKNIDSMTIYINRSYIYIHILHDYYGMELQILTRRKPVLGLGAQLLLNVLLLLHHLSRAWCVCSCYINYLLMLATLSLYYIAKLDLLPCV